jgi:hypothetical protein
VRYATCSVSPERAEQQSNRATEHSAGHVTLRSAVLAVGRDERRRIQTFCLRPHHSRLEGLLPCGSPDSGDLTAQD